MGVSGLAIPPGLRYVLGRIAQLVPTLVGVTLFAFIVIRLSGDPTSVLLPADASETEREAFRRAYGLDRPILEQYVRTSAGSSAGTSASRCSRASRRSGWSSTASPSPSSSRGPRSAW